MWGTKVKVAVGFLCGAGLTAGMAYAAIPAVDGTIKGCYATTSGIVLGIPHSKGDLRAVDSTEACRSYEKAVTWNQKGVPGANGTNGVNGAQGPAGPAGETGPAGSAAPSPLWAYVDGNDGRLADGTAVAARRDELGKYTVTFDRSVLHCAPIVTSGQSGNQHNPGPNWFTTPVTYVGGSNDHEVSVDFHDPLLYGQPSTHPSDPTAEDSSFHLVVIC